MIFCIKLVISAVAPYAGAWIEIGGKCIKSFLKSVAPYAGAWIEIVSATAWKAAIFSRSLRGSVD